MNLMYRPDNLFIGRIQPKMVQCVLGHCHSICQHRGAQDFPKEKDV